MKGGELMSEIRILDENHTVTTFLPTTSKVLITKEKLPSELHNQYINDGYSIITI